MNFRVGMNCSPCFGDVVWYGKSLSSGTG